MRSTVVRLALVTVIAAAVGCGVTDADIDHWKRTQRGPGKITAVLVGAKYPQPLRVHAARALIEMKHPNANGLDLLVQAMVAMPPSEREGIIHELLDPLRSQMRGAEQGASAQGPSEPQIRAKDAAFQLLRFASPADRAEIANELISWLLTDLNTRALAGQYTAEQIVTAVGAQAGDRLVQAFTSNENDIRVAINVAQLVQSVGTDSIKDAAARRLIAVATEIAGPASTERLRTNARQLLARSSPPNTPIPDARLTRAVDSLRTTYLNIVYEALRHLGRPAGTEFLIRVAADAAAPMERRKAVLAAVAGHVRASDAPALLAIANNPANTDIELKGLAIDRVGEARNATVVEPLYALFDAANGGEANQEFTYRWKIGEAILKLRGPVEVPRFVARLASRRPAAGTFEGYAYAEINGYALTVGDFSPPPRDAMRGLLSNDNAYVKALALLFLAAKGEAADLPRVQALANDATPLAGPGWAAIQSTTVGAVARRTADALRRGLGQPAAGAAPAAAAAGARR